MASELKVDKFTGVTTAGSIDVTGEGNSTTTNLQQGLAKSWLKMNGSSTIVVEDSFNNASITDNGTGTYARALTNALANDDYSTGGSQQLSQSNYAISSFTTTTHAMFVRNDAGTFSDANHVSVQNFGDLA